MHDFTNFSFKFEKISTKNNINKQCKHRLVQVKKLYYQSHQLLNSS
uniref:Uncharacterized protein n=1 Tax=Amphimedon queenslandica TaxID=400682 RepID=A0A1X7UXH2_AMPQE